MARRTYDTPEACPTRRAIEHPHKPGHLLPVHGRPVRLPGVDYASPACICFVTWRLRDEEHVLVGDAAQTAWTALLEACEFCGAMLHAACLMPDHIHMLVSPGADGRAIDDVVKAAKARMLHRVQSEHGIWLRWQSSFHDHVLRGSEDEFVALVWYVVQNPVRAGLATESEAYPYTYHRVV